MHSDTVEQTALDTQWATSRIDAQERKREGWKPSHWTLQVDAGGLQCSGLVTGSETVQMSSSNAKSNKRSQLTIIQGQRLKTARKGLGIVSFGARGEGIRYSNKAKYKELTWMQGNAVAGQLSKVCKMWVLYKTVRSHEDKRTERNYLTRTRDLRLMISGNQSVLLIVRWSLHISQFSINKVKAGD